MGAREGRVAGKTAIVTAAGQGIGREIALAFAREGAVVHAVDINAAAVDAVAGESDAMHAHAVDVTDQDSIQALAGEVPGPDVLVNGAGTVHHGTILDCDEAAWDFSFDLNVKSMYRTIRAFLPAMLESGGGSIVNMASVASSLQGIPNRCVYGASKAAVIGLTKTLALEFGREGLRVNAVCPGGTKTAFLQGFQIDEKIDLSLLGRTGLHTLPRSSLVRRSKRPARLPAARSG